MPTEIECCGTCRSTVPTQWLRAHRCTCECFTFLVVPSCLLHSCHMLVLTDALTSSSQDSSQKSQRSVHPCSRIVEQIVDAPSTTVVGADWDLAGFPFRVREPPHFCERHVRSASARRRVSNRGERDSGNCRDFCAHPNVAPHTARLVGDTDHGTKFETGTTSAKRVRNEFEAGRQLVSVNAPKTVGRRFAMLQVCVFRQSSRKRGKHVYENLAASKLDDDVNISVVLCAAPSQFRDNLLVNSQQIESYYNQLRAITQAYLNSNKNGFRLTSDVTRRSRVRWILTALPKAMATTKNNVEGKDARPDT